MQRATITDMKARADSLSDELGLTPLIVTQDGKESLVVQTREAFEHQHEKIAFLELLIKSRKDIDKESATPVDDFLSSI